MPTKQNNLHWSPRLLAIVAVGWMIWMGYGTIVGEAAAPPPAFNHDRTHFPLTGQHQRVDCEGCHTGGRYENLPTQCGACHNGQRASGKPASHVVTTAQCDACHGTTSFSGATFAHDATTAGRCDTCHNGRTAPGKPTSHIATTAQCDTCHNTRSFAGAGFAHDATTAGRCDTCHNGRTAPGKPTSHIATTSQCDQCHRTTTWIPATYANHANPLLIGGHSGLECSVCHPQSFTSAFYRDGAQFGFCSNCHRRDYDPREGDHNNATLQVNANCANCHRHAGYRW